MNKKTLIWILAAILVIVIVVAVLATTGKKAAASPEAQSAAPATEAPAKTEAPKETQKEDKDMTTPPRPTLNVKVEKDELNGSGVEEITEDEWQKMQSSEPVVGTVSVDPPSGELSGEIQVEPSQDDPSAMSYAAYSALSAEEQYAFMQSFESPEAFLNWYNAAKAAYDASNPVHVLQPGDVIDLGE